MQVTKQLRTETGHRLTNYDGRCSHLHGHSYLWEVTARAHKLDDKNMVIDFKDLKKAMNTVLDPLDHCLVLAKDDPLWMLDSNNAGPLSEILKATNGAEPRLIKWHENPTAESFAQYALERIQEVLQAAWLSDPMNVDIEDGGVFLMPHFIYSVRVWETATSYAEAKSGEG